MGTLGIYLSSGLVLAKAQPVDIKSALSLVETGRCERDATFVLAIHGGAVFSRSDQGPKTAFARQALTEARGVLALGARAIDVVEAVIASMENSGVFNAGKGSNANKAGVIEMDASIMDGYTLKAGAVASIKAVRNPISAARLVMDKSRHVMMVGPDADKFVAENGGEVADVTYFLHGGHNFSDVVLPDDMRITPPDDGVAPDKAAFSGTWGGVWAGSLNHVLVVEKIGSDGAEVIYGIGPYEEFNQGYYDRQTALFENGGLRVIRPSHRGGFIITYRLNADGTLKAKATKKYGGEVYETTLHRLTAPRTGDEEGTVGAVARDRCGDLASGTSTGGFGSKTPGRVGDSSIIGAGTYASNETAAISATGRGELFMRHVVAHAIAAAMKYKGLSLEEAATNIINYELFRKGLRGGVIAVDGDGNVTTPYNTEGMVRGTTSNDSAPMVEVY